jgi:hypothetical protein
MVNMPVTSSENKNTESTIKLKEETRSIIHASVKNYKNEPLEDAVVMLFELDDSCSPPSLKSVYHTFTDEYGYFILGPLTPDKHYILKVWADNLKCREFEINSENQKIQI